MSSSAPSATKGDVCLTPELWVCLGRMTAPRMLLCLGGTCCSPGSASHLLAKPGYLLATCQHPAKCSPSFPTLSATSWPCSALQPQGLEFLKKGGALKSVNCTVLKYDCECCQCLDAWLRPFSVSSIALNPSLAVLVHCWYHGFMSESGIEARGKELVQMGHDRLVPQAFACLGASAKKERTRLMLEQVNQSNILPLDIPLCSCSLRPGSGNRGGKRQLRCQQLCLLGTSVAFASAVLWGENKFSNKSCKCPLCSVPVPAPCVFPGLLSLASSGTF